MTEPTPADRSAAHWLAEELAEVLDDASGLWGAGVDLIAKALAIARETARAPFLAEAQDFDAESIMAPNEEAEQVWRDAADRIRRIAGEVS